MTIRIGRLEATARPDFANAWHQVVQHRHTFTRDRKLRISTQKPYVTLSSTPDLILATLLQFSTDML